MSTEFKIEFFNRVEKLQKAADQTAMKKWGCDAQNDDVSYDYYRDTVNNKTGKVVKKGKAPEITFMYSDCYTHEHLGAISFTY